MNVQVYRKATHTDQYQRFNTHHQLNHKLGVICTFYDQCDNIVTEEVDAVAEITHVDKALERCWYPTWSFRRVRDSMDKKKHDCEARKKKEEDDRDTQTTVTIPCVKGFWKP